MHLDREGVLVGISFKSSGAWSIPPRNATFGQRRVETNCASTLHEPTSDVIGSTSVLMHNILSTYKRVKSG